MKKRQGFVSNSSSSSFICNICGNTESGCDANPSDLGFKECRYGHLFCEDHEDIEVIISKNDLITCLQKEYSEDSYEELVKKLTDMDEEQYIEWNKSDEAEKYLDMYYYNEISSEYCPLCQMQEKEKK